MSYIIIMILCIIIALIIAFTCTKNNIKIEKKIDMNYGHQHILSRRDNPF